MNRNGCIAFYPWLRLEEKKVFGNFELVPFKIKNQALQLSSAEEDADVRGVASNYYDQVGNPIREIVVLKKVGSNANLALESDTIDSYFIFNELLSFSSLSRRRFFSYSYWNRDNFQLVIQKFVLPDYTPSVVNRRRDGSMMQKFAKGMFKASPPLQVSISEKIDIDDDFLTSLMAAWTDDIPQWPSIYESIQSYNLANTDSGQIREHLELVMLNGSFERLFEISKGKMEPLRDHFVETFEKVIQDPHLVIQKNIGTLNYKTNFKLREAFIRDLFNIRGHLAHGKIVHNYPSLWSLKEHLLFASYIFPLAVKFHMAKADKYSLSQEDKLQVFTFDHLLASTSVFEETPPQSQQFMWTKIVIDCSWAVMYSAENEDETPNSGDTNLT